MGDVESNFLALLASGESGGYSNPATIGVGGTDLSGASTYADGFPIWSGITTSAGPSHAAGIYQFEPSTWASQASQLGLTDFSAASQNSAAWNLANQVYSKATGGGSLSDAFTSGNFSSIVSALKSTWPSVTKSFGSGATSGNGSSGSSTPYIGGSLNPANWIVMLQEWLAESKFWQRLLFGVLGLLLIGAAFALLAKGQVTQIAKEAL